MSVSKYFLLFWPKYVMNGSYFVCLGQYPALDALLHSERRSLIGFGERQSRVQLILRLFYTL